MIWANIRSVSLLRLTEKVLHDLSRMNLRSEIGESDHLVFVLQLKYFSI